MDLFLSTATADSSTALRSGRNDIFLVASLLQALFLREDDSPTL
jgi:hypothetical protein